MPLKDNVKLTKKMKGKGKRSQSDSGRNRNKESRMIGPEWSNRLRTRTRTQDRLNSPNSSTAEKHIEMMIFTRAVMRILARRT